MAEHRDLMPQQRAGTAEPALLAVAHGSTDPRAEGVLEVLIARVRAERPGLTAMLAHLGHTAPGVPSALKTLVAEGFSEIVVVPLLLTSAYHARIDLPAILDAARAAHGNLSIVQAKVLGPHPLLFSLVRRRLVEVGADSSTAVVLGAIGTSDAVANAELADVAATIGASIGFAAGAPHVGDVVNEVRARGASQVAVAAYVLAPGVLPDRFAATSADIVTRPLGAEPEVVDVVLERYDDAVRSRQRSGSIAIER
ncbi:MAG: sirohydrochlorin chelatase [Acidothermaceae bacterium]